MSLGLGAVGQARFLGGGIGGWLGTGGPVSGSLLVAATGNRCLLQIIQWMCSVR